MQSRSSAASSGAGRVPRVPESCGGGDFEAFCDPGFAVASGAAPGRRIYVHEQSFADLARQSRPAARLTYTMLIRIAGTRMVRHRVLEDGVMLGLITADRARALTEYIEHAWADAATHGLQAISYAPSRAGGPHGELPLLGDNEHVEGTCYFSNYYTFATGPVAAALMFSDSNSIAEIKARLGVGMGYDDMTLVSGPRLSLARQIRDEGAADGEPFEANEVQDAVAAEFVESLHALVHQSMGELTATEQPLIDDVESGVLRTFHSRITRVH